MINVLLYFVKGSFRPKVHKNFHSNKYCRWLINRFFSVASAFWLDSSKPNSDKILFSILYYRNFLAKSVQHSKYCKWLIEQWKIKEIVRNIQFWIRFWTNIVFLDCFGLTKNFFKKWNWNRTNENIFHQYSNFPPSSYYYSCYVSSP